MSVVRRVHVHGPLVVFADGFEAELERLGFTPLSRVDQLRLMAHLSCWLDAEGVVVSGMSAGHVEAFLHERRSTRSARTTSPQNTVRTMRRALPTSTSTASR